MTRKEWNIGRQTVGPVAELGHTRRNKMIDIERYCAIGNSLITFWEISQNVSFIYRKTYTNPSGRQTVTWSL